MGIEEEESPLTEAEIRDVVCAYRSLNPVDAEIKQEVLDDAGIPNSLVGGSLPFGGMGFAPLKIMVPRVLVENARLIMAKAEEDAKREGVEIAFTEEALQEFMDNPDPEPELAEIFEMRARHPGPRDEELAVYVATWLVVPLQVYELAQRLALAGLNLEDAKSIVKWVADERADLIETARRDLYEKSLNKAADAAPEALLNPIGWPALKKVAAGLDQAYQASGSGPVLKRLLPEDDAKPDDANASDSTP